MKEEVEQELGIVAGEETASGAFFAELGAYKERF